MPGQDKTLGKTSFGWNGIATPFEVLADRLYSCGDTFTNVYLFVSDPDENGKKTYNAIDGGNAIANYGYWLNYWKVGYDPRQLDNMLLTHGHGDHYESLYELSTMVNRAAGYDKLNVLTCIADKDGYISSANAPFGDKEINSLNDASIKKAFPGTGYCWVKPHKLAQLCIA